MQERRFAQEVGSQRCPAMNSRWRSLVGFERDHYRNFRVKASRFTLHEGRKKLPLLESAADRAVNERIAALHFAGGHITLLIDFCLHSNGQLGGPELRKDIGGKLRIH